MTAKAVIPSNTAPLTTSDSERELSASEESMAAYLSLGMGWQDPGAHAGKQQHNNNDKNRVEN